MLSKIQSAKRVIAGFTSMLLGQKAKVVWGRGAMFDDSGQITLPSPSTGDDDETGLLTRLAVHETGHARYSDLGAIKDVSSLQMHFVNCLEDARIEALQMQDLPGAALILNRGLLQLLERREASLDLTSPEDQIWLIGTSCLMRAQAHLGRFAQMPPYHPIAAKCYELVKKADALLAPEKVRLLQELCQEIEHCHNTADVVELGGRILNMLMQPPNQQQPNQGPNPENGQQSSPGDETDQGQGSFEGQDQSKGEHSAEQNDPENETDGQSGQEGQKAHPIADETSMSDANQGGEVKDGEDFTLGKAETQDDGQELQQPGQGQSDGSEGDNPAEQEQAGGQDSGQCNVQSENSGPSPVERPETGHLDWSKFEQVKPQDMGSMIRQELSDSGYAQLEELEEPQPQVQQAPGQKSSVSQSAGPEAEESTESNDEDAKMLAAALQGAEEDGVDETQLIELLEQALEQTEAEDLDSVESMDSPLQEEQSSAGAGTGGASILGAVAPEVRLSGYAGHVARVFTKALQDKLHKNLMPSKRGVRLIAQRVWRAERLGDTRIYRGRSQTTGIETSMMLLLDRSGSMSDTIQTALSAAVCCAQGLERLHTCKTAISLFPGEHYYSVAYEPLMKFGESTRRIFKKIDGIAADGGTPTGQAIVQACLDLKSRRTHKHVLGVITDGRPDDWASAVAALEFAKQQNVEVFGIGVGPLAAPILNLIARSRVIKDVSELADALEEIFSSDIEALAA
jgi:uncharacterized protein YegL